ncbi:MAG TPA: type I polyketide synthase, partial [Bacteroidales bacterium]|nr:type I polyketide synthase [Bacteroidales bacterium]
MSNNQAIAVTGMACRFPGASDINEFWNNLVDGKDTIRHFIDDELAGYENDFEALRQNPDYVRARGILNDIDKFDPAFFGMTPNEAAGTDPQHRVWLETAWNALEDSGCDPSRFHGSIGVFAGGYINTYLLNNILRDRSKLENYIRLRTTESFQILTGNDAAFIPTKTAYKFNLRGPAVNVQTACSTSLVAISLACQSLFSYESDVCIAGGVCIVVPQESGYIYQKGAIPSPDGRCRPFDEKGNGTVFSNGVGVVVLKRLEDALRDHDRIYALVRGWSLNNDGSTKVSYTAPSVEGQANAIMMAQSFSGVSPLQIGYIEAHGTATQLGDPVELTALNRVFSGSTGKKQFCGIGSVKSNIGHTDAAAGVASFIKSCLSAYHRIIPPTLHFTKPNPNFDFENSPFYVQEKLKKWDEKDPLIIGISSFGIGGTNAHVIIEEPPETLSAVKAEPVMPYLLPVSAKSEDSLAARQRDLAQFVDRPGIDLSDVAHTLQEGRTHMPLRSFCVARNIEGIKEGSGFSPVIKSADQECRIVFMFSGQGAQYPGMGKELYEFVPVFRKILDECFDIFRSETGTDLKEILFDAKDDSAVQLARTGITQPALFIVEYALAKLYYELGIKPHYLIGHSIGEYAAACLSGVFDMKTGLRIVTRRGSLMQKMPGGKMLAVRCSAADLIKLECSDFEVAADNARNQCTISYPQDSEERVKSVLDKHGMKYIKLNTSHAFHSSAFEPVMEEFESFVDSFQLKAPEIPFISCLTGKLITDEQAVSGRYWAQQLRNTVLFRKGISTIAEGENVVFLEVGPETHLTGLARQNPDVSNKNAVISSLGKKDEADERTRIISSLGYLWANGVNIDFSLLRNGRES